MPIYDYFCDCGESKLDEIVKNYKEVVKCDSCDQQMEKGLSAPNLIGFDSNGTSKTRIKKP